MPPIYKALTAVVALTGDLSIIITGEVNPLFFIPGALVLLGYLRAIQGRPQLSRYAVGGLSTVSLLVFGVEVVYISCDLIVAVSHLTILFHSIKSLDIKDPWDSLQVFFMTLIQVLLASELTSSLFFGVVFILFMIVTAISLFYSHLLQQGIHSMRGYLRQALTVTFIVSILSILLFPAIPRLKGSLWGKSLGRGMKSGFSEKVQLGELQDLKLDRTPVMRVTVTPPFRGIPYWRGITFEFYENNTWQDLETSKMVIQSSDGEFEIGPGGSGPRYSQEFILEPLDTEYIFLLGRIRKLRTSARRIMRHNDGALSIPFKKGKRIRYTVQSTAAPLPPTLDDYLYLQMPKGMDRVRELALSVTERLASTFEKAKAIEGFLKREYIYSLTVPAPVEGLTPVEDFLFRSRRGYCEYYATAMALMLRSIGIPARVVAGYMGGEFNSYGNYYIVRQSDAHTWVEAMIGRKWETFDPTPPAQAERRHPLNLFMDYLKLNWERYVVGFSRYDQASIMRRLSLPSMKWSGRGMPHGRRLVLPTGITLLGVIFLIIIILYFRSGPFRLPPESRLYARLRKVLVGEMRGEYTSRVEMERQIKALPKDTKELVMEFISLYERIRFSGVSDQKDLKHLKTLYNRLRRDHLLTKAKKNLNAS